MRGRFFSSARGRHRVGLGWTVGFRGVFWAGHSGGASDCFRAVDKCRVGLGFPQATPVSLLLAAAASSFASSSLEASFEVCCRLCFQSRARTTMSSPTAGATASTTRTATRAQHLQQQQQQRQEQPQQHRQFHCPTLHVRSVASAGGEGRRTGTGGRRGREAGAPAEILGSS